MKHIFAVRTGWILDKFVPEKKDSVVFVRILTLQISHSHIVLALWITIIAMLRLLRLFSPEVCNNSYSMKTAVMISAPNHIALFSYHPHRIYCRHRCTSKWSICTGRHAKWFCVHNIIEQQNKVVTHYNGQIWVTTNRYMTLLRTLPYV